MAGNRELTLRQCSKCKEHKTDDPEIVASLLGYLKDDRGGL